MFEMTSPSRSSLSDGTFAKAVGRDGSPTPSIDKGSHGEFKLGFRGALVFFTLAVLTLMAALDGTSLSVALPVSITLFTLYERAAHVG